MRKVLLVSITLVAFLMCLVAIPAQAVRPTEAEIGEAIEKGLAWLAANQASNGCWIEYSTYYYLADTASAVLAFEDEGHFPGSTSAYAGVVESGLDYILSLANIQDSLPTQSAGNPDSNGNGKGVYFQQRSMVYETGLCLMAIVASNTPDRIVTVGPCTGWTYYEVVQDVVDWLAYAQNDSNTGNWRGGWRYVANYGDSDNSASQWPVLGMIAAEQWGIYAPDWVKTELNYWVNYIQDSSGGAGYRFPNDSVNVAKTGGLLVEQYWLGDEADESTRVQNAIAYVEQRWDQALSCRDNGNIGQTYAMFAVYKGLALLGVDILAAVEPDDDWWLDYCEYIVNSQVPAGTGQGYWNGSCNSTWYDYYLTTGWYIVILQGTIFPLDVDVDVPDCVCEIDGYDVEIEYSVARFPVSGVLEVYMDDILMTTVTLTDFQGEDSITYTVDPGTLGAEPGTHTWSAVLDVTTAESVDVQAEGSDSIAVCLSPVVGDIPDQVIPDYTQPYPAFDLDDYLVVDNGNGYVPGSISTDPAVSTIVWSAAAPAGWVVDINADNFVTVTAPSAAPGTITFTATVVCCGEVACSDSDDATFDPNTVPVPVAKVITTGCGLTVGFPVQLDGSESYDADGDELTYHWILSDGSVSEEMNPTIIYQTEGQHIEALRVNDGIIDSGLSMVNVQIAPRLKVLSVTYDVVTTMLTFEFNKPAKPFPICFGEIGMDIVEDCEEYQCGWDIKLSRDPDFRLHAVEMEPSTTLSVDINRAHPATVNLAVAALMQHLDVNLLLGEGAFVDECDIGSLPVACADEILIQMITHGFVLGKAGDVTGDGEISPLDAALILQESVGVPAEEIYPIYSTAMEINGWLEANGSSEDLMLSTADMSGDGYISAFDAALTLRVSIGLPPIPELAPDLASSIKKGRIKVSSFDSQKLEVTIDLNDVSHVYSADMVLLYDPQVLTVTDVSGTAATAEWLSEYGTESGRLRISMAGATPPAADGSLIRVKFDSNGSKDAIEKLELTDFRLNGGLLKATIENLPKLFALLQNYPNPFNPETWIPYRLSEPADVSITIYNVNGQMVRQLELGSRMPGFYVDKSKAAYWDGTNESGEAVSSGIYFYKMQAGRNFSIKKMIIVR